MIQFAPLRTNRLTVNLREMSIDDGEALCMMPEAFEQASTTAMLRMVVQDEGKPLPGQVTDPLLWTVQERTFVMAHYMAHTTGDGEQNFKIGENARFSDYFVGGTDYIDRVDLGMVCGDHVVMRPLLGFQAEAIERLVLQGRLRKNRLSWWAAAIACQMSVITEEPMAWENDTQYSEWLLERATGVRKLPESEFTEILAAFLEGTDQLSHFFSIQFSDDLITMLPSKADGEEVSDLPPARFPFRTCISEFALRAIGVAG